MFLNSYIEILSRDYNPRLEKKKPKQPAYARKKCKSCKYFETVCGNNWSANGRRRKATNSACERYVPGK